MLKKSLFIVLFALCACAVFAEDADSLRVSVSTRDFRLDELEVTARSLTKDVIVPQTLKGEELQRLSALSVADALRYFSGVQLKDYGGVGGIKTINIRSMGSQHTAVYYNGVQLGNAQNGQIDLGRFSLDNMEAIELYNGQKSDIYQSAREFGAAGNVYLTTRRPYFKSGENVHMHAQMRFGSFHLANPNIGVDVRLTDQLVLTMDAEYVYSDGKYPFRYRRVLPNGETARDQNRLGAELPRPLDHTGKRIAQLRAALFRLALRKLAFDLRPEVQVGGMDQFHGTFPLSVLSEKVYHTERGLSSENARFY